MNEYISENTTVLLNPEFHDSLFNQIIERFKNYKQFAEFLGISKGNLFAWKLRKNRISIRILKEICISLDILFNKALENIYETDREIAEII